MSRGPRELAEEERGSRRAVEADSGEAGLHVETDGRGEHQI